MKSRHIATYLGVNVYSVYNWTKQGFIDLLCPQRSAGGHRRFSDEFLEDLKLVRDLQALGLTAEASFNLVARDKDLSERVRVTLSGVI